MAEDAFARDRRVREKRDHIARQEQAIAHLAANGRSTARAEQHLATLRRGLNAMFSRRHAKAGMQGNTPPLAAPGQRGPARQQGQPGAEAP